MSNSNGIHTQYGRILSVGATLAAAISTSRMADMSANWVTELLKMPPGKNDIAIEVLYSGAPDTGAFTVFGCNAGPPVDLELVGISDTDGTSYAANLSTLNADSVSLTDAELTALRSADAGTRMIYITGCAAGYLQVRYTAGSATGDGVIRVRSVV